uniref:Putative secreted protein n=1 Tax=Panstrongylus lignarius TaxID=156445 RepID=A0A224Y417_9HEMI
MSPFALLSSLIFFCTSISLSTPSTNTVLISTSENRFSNPHEFLIPSLLSKFLVADLTIYTKRRVLSSTWHFFSHL